MFCDRLSWRLKVYLGKDERLLLRHTDHSEAAQASDEEGVVGLRPVAAHHLHRYSRSADPTRQRQRELREWVGDSEEPRKITQSDAFSEYCKHK